MLKRCMRTERPGVVIRFYLALVNTIIIVRHRAPPAPGCLETVSPGHSAEALPVNASITYWRKP
jgi:hypothetical protein